MGVVNCVCERERDWEVEGVCVCIRYTVAATSMRFASTGICVWWIDLASKMWPIKNYMTLYIGYMITLIVLCFVYGSY